MGNNTTQDILKIWDQLSQKPASDYTQSLIELLVAYKELLNGHKAFMFGAIKVGTKDLSDGWRPFRIQFDSEQNDNVKRFKYAQKTFAERQALISGAGNFRAYRLGDIIDDEYRQSKEYKNFYEVDNVHDAIFVVVPICSTIELCYTLYRNKNQPTFSQKDVDTLSELLQGLMWFHRKIVISYGIHLHDSPLTPKEEIILQKTLSEKSVENISKELNQSANTTKTHLKNICYKYGVKGRSGLLNLWLNPMAFLESEIQGQ